LTKAVSIGVLMSAVALSSSCSSDTADPVADGPAEVVTSTTAHPPSTVRPFEPEAEADATRVIVDDVSLDSGRHIAIAFHPDRSPARVWSSSPAFEVCPASTEGTVGKDSGWPTWVPFEGCAPLGTAGFVLPTADGSTHLGFAVRATDAVDRARVIIDYGRRDGFFEVLPPAGRATDLDVTFTPGSSTITAIAYDLPNYSPSKSAQIETLQDQAIIDAAADCDFPSESDCLGPVTAGIPVTVRLHDKGSGGLQVALFLGWS
jgi:hypothetical protein